MCFLRRELSCAYALGLSQLSRKRGALRIVRHTSLRSDGTAELWPLNAREFMEIPDLHTASNMPSCAWSPWPLFFSAGCLYVSIMTGQDWLFWPVNATASSTLPTVLFQRLPKLGFSLTLSWSPAEKAPCGMSDEDSRDTWVLQLATPAKGSARRGGFCGNCLVSKPQ